MVMAFTIPFPHWMDLTTRSIGSLPCQSKLRWYNLSTEKTRRIIMQFKKRIVGISVLVIVLMAFSGVIAHLSSNTTLEAEQAPQPENVTKAAAIPMVSDNP